MSRQEANQLGYDIALRQVELDRMKAELAAIHRGCRHQWGDIGYCPIRTEAYTSPGDEPGTMGVDFRGPCHFPATTTKQWERTCAKCGLNQKTQRVKPVHAAGAFAGTSATQEVPDFGG